ncbi:MAG: valine--tRNA ligase [Sulfolobales archaeon]
MGKIELNRWRPDEELKLLEIWEREGLYREEVDLASDENYVVIDTPPPYPSGPWGVAQAAHYAQIDMIARAFRLLGYKVLVPFYADRNGLPAEVAAEKTYGIVAHEMVKTVEGREAFLKMVSDLLDKNESSLVSVWKRLGCLFDYWREGTDSPKYRAMTQATFIELWKRGLIYKDIKPVQWCPRCRTSLAEAEIDFVSEVGKLYYIKFKVLETGEDIVIATTRPELLAACGAVIYNPGDDRYKHLEGKKAIVPVYGHSVPIIPHEMARPEYGTGLAMMCSYGDVRDLLFFKETGIEPKVIIEKDGTMNDLAGPLAGLKVADARQKIVRILKEEGLIVREEEINHEVPVCWRCKTPVEIVHVEEYFLNQLSFKDRVLEIADLMEFYPAEHRMRLDQWVKSLAMDWPISRTRYYGTEVPLWTCSKCGHTILPEPGSYVRPWKEPPPVDRCPSCGAPREFIVGEERVFDTWFDSSISVLYVTGWLKNPEVATKALSRALRPQGYDIIRTWLYYTILRVWMLTGRPPFKWVRITGMGLDEKGRAMHKSLGNVIYPEPYIEKYGADAFRFWSAVASKLGSDYRWSEATVKTGLLFSTKLINIARFVTSFEEPSGQWVLRPLDKAMIAYAVKVARGVIDSYMKLDVYEPTLKLYHLLWDVFASNYVEMVKPRVYRKAPFTDAEVRGAVYTLYRVLKLSLKLLSPIMPFTCDYLWRSLEGRTIAREKLKDEELQDYGGSAELMEKVVNVNSAIWKWKKERGMRLSEKIGGVIYLPEELRGVAEDIRYFHNVREVTVGKPESWDFELMTGVYLKLG